MVRVGRPWDFKGVLERPVFQRIWNNTNRAAILFIVLEAQGIYTIFINAAWTNPRLGKEHWYSLTTMSKHTGSACCLFPSAPSCPQILYIHNWHNLNLSLDIFGNSTAPSYTMLHQLSTSRPTVYTIPVKRSLWTNRLHLRNEPSSLFCWNTAQPEPPKRSELRRRVEDVPRGGGSASFLLPAAALQEMVGRSKLGLEWYNGIILEPFFLLKIMFSSWFLATLLSYSSVLPFTTSFWSIGKTNFHPPN